MTTLDLRCKCFTLSVSLLLEASVFQIRTMPVEEFYLFFTMDIDKHPCKCASVSSVANSPLFLGQVYLDK